MKLDQILVVIAAGGVGFIVKIVWDWLYSGRVEKGIFVTVEHCEKSRDKCGTPMLKKDMGILDTRVATIEKQMDEGRENFKILRNDIAGINESLAGIEAFLRATLNKKG